ncbi:hypothetical protein [Pseudoroseicyclus sp. CXY001]|uniref:hypothetical protein n=1 Tax=Pseudoroseicyclus sp. CXY001 TaxID=3242492 RepID=UPI00358DCDF7
MSGYTIAAGEDAQLRLLSLIDEGAELIALDAETPLDAAGAQLIAAAILTSRRGGTPLGLQMAEGSDAADLWARLGFDSLAPAAPLPEAAS